MPYKLIISFIFVVILLGVASSVGIEMKDEYLRGESVLVKISGNFFDQPTRNDVHFYKRHIETTFGEYDFLEIEGIYYLYFDILNNKAVDTYSVVLEGMKYYERGQLKEGDIKVEFKVREEFAPFSIDPYVQKAGNSYTVTLKNLIDSPIKINYVRETESGKLNLGYGSEDFSFDSLANGIEKINFSYEGQSYEVLVYVTPLENICEMKGHRCVLGSTSCVGDIINFECGDERVCCNESDESPGEILCEAEGNYCIYQTEECIGYLIDEYICYDGKICCTELGEENQSGDLEKNPVKDPLEDPEENEAEEPSEDPVEEPEEQNDSTGSSFWDSIFGKGKTEEKNKTISAKNCSEVGLQICKGEYVCDADTVSGFDGNCCPGNCIIKQENSKWKIVGWSLIFAIVLFLVWFFKKKYRGASTGLA